MPQAPLPDPQGGGARAAVAAALARRATLLTPNLRSARYWSRSYDAAMRLGGAATWESPSILPWRAWTSTLWTSSILAGTEDRVAMNELQEAALWERIIPRDGSGSLLPVHSQAKLCSGALRLLAQYDVEGRFSPEMPGGDEELTDADTFRRWYRQLEDTCREERLLPSAYLEMELAAAFRERRLPPEAEYVLWSFPSFTPAQERLLDTLRQCGANVVVLDDDGGRRQRTHLRSYELPRAEVEGCLEGARAWLEEQRGATFTIVVPDLDTTRPALERDLRSALDPAASDVTRPSRPLLYEFSVGRPLGRLPMVADALCLLRWCAEELPVEEAGAVLRSSNLRIAASPESGAELDSRLLRRHLPLQGTISMQRAARLFDTAENAGTAKVLRAVHSAARSLQHEAKSWADYCDGMRLLLREAGWPGAKPLDSQEFQAADRWDEALDRLATLDLLGGAPTLRDFVHRLERVVLSTSFLPENMGAPLQIVTVGEAAGTPTDALWFLHAEEDSWPQRQSTHPFLPWGLQRECGMPGIDAARDESIAQRMLQTLADGAGHSTFSYPRHNDAGEQQPSSLVERFAEACGADFIPMEAETAVLPARSLAIEVEDRSTIPPLPGGVTTGGVSVLTAQGQCGFRAFAEKRLFSAPLEPVGAGQEPRERGEDVHRVLELFWTRIRSRKELLSLSSEACESLLRDCIDQALVKPFARAEAPWDRSYMEVQRERLYRLLREWLQVEASRPDFTVAALEKKVDGAEIGPLRLNLRVDRVDQVHSPGEPDSTLVIDYKTGRASYADWLGPRPDQPQLPVYAVAGAAATEGKHVDGLAFGVVRVGAKNMKMDGLSGPDSPIDMGRRSIADFEEQVETWRRDLVALAEAFAQGNAQLNPKDYPTTCERCTQRIFCRLDPAALLQAEDAQDDEESEVPAWT